MNIKLSNTHGISVNLYVHKYQPLWKIHLRTLRLGVSGVTEANDYQHIYQKII